MFKAVTREERGCVQAPDAVVANKDEFSVFRRFRDDFLHQFLSEKRGTFDVNGIPLLPAANINQWELFACLQPLRDLSGRDLHPLICFVPGQDCTDYFLDREIVVSRTNRGQSFARTKAAARTAPNVVGPEKSSLSTGVLLKKLCHRHVGVNCSRHTHEYSALHHFVGKSKGPVSGADCHSTTNPSFEMDALNRRRNTLVAGAALVLFATVYYSLIYRYGLNLADEGNVALISQRLLHGERPFLNVSLGYNVLWFYPISTLFRLFGTNLLLMRTYFYGISTASGLIAFMLLRRLDAPLWLAFAQGLAVISVTGQYFMAYIPFLVLSNLFAITLFLTSQRKAILSVGAGLLLGTTYLIRIDVGIFLTAIWFGVILLHAVLLDRRLRLNLIVAGNFFLGVAVMHLPFIYDAYHRHFLQPFAHQYSNIAGLILRPILPHPTQTVAKNQDQSGVAHGAATHY